MTNALAGRSKTSPGVQLTPTSDWIVLRFSGLEHTVDVEQPTLPPCESRTDTLMDLAVEHVPPLVEGDAVLEKRGIEVIPDIIANAGGDMVPSPRLHNTAERKGPKVKTALPASAVRARLNHFQMLRLGAFAAQQPG